MSALRLGRLPDGTRDIRIIDDGAVGRVTHSRLGIRGGNEPVTPKGPAVDRTHKRTEVKP